MANEATQYISRGTSGYGTLGALSRLSYQVSLPGRDLNPRPPALQAKYPQPTPPAEL
ncbi:MAG TPA: hypothetical protein VGI45_33435 [Terracidiphilus sp.]